MEQKVAILIVHGIGTQTGGYADEFVWKLADCYEKASKRSAEDLVIQPVLWQTEIQPYENELFEKVNHLKWVKLREFFIGHAGDALAYQPSFSDEGFYKSAHKCIDKALVNLYNNVPKGTPLCVVSHSLGTVVMTNYIWDCQNITSTGRLSFRPSQDAVNAINCLELFVTMGSPIATWALRYKDGGEPIKLPHYAKWINLYGKSDIISSPLAFINQQYYSMKNLYDIELKVGNLLKFWNPLSHTEYWTSKSVLNQIATHLAELVTKNITFKEEYGYAND